MSMRFIKKMPTADEIIEEMPLSKHIKEIKKNRDEEI